MFAVLFFGHYAGMAVFAVYITGLFFAVVSGLLFKKLMFNGKGHEFVMELPSYHLPTMNAIIMHTWFKLKGFILRAGQTILLVIIVLTLINSLVVRENPISGEKDTILTLSGKAITPIFYPMGIERENWGATVALFTGLFAKEAIVGTLEAVNLVPEVQKSESFDLKAFIKSSGQSFYDELKTALSKIIMPFKQESTETEQISDEHPLKYKFKNIHQVIAYLLFIIIYAPCAASISTTIKEAGMKIAMFQMIYLTMMAWIIATVYYQIAVYNTSSIIFMLISVVLFFMLLIYMKRLSIEE
jgi:ferrous iron transport protein B